LLYVIPVFKVFPVVRPILNIGCHGHRNVRVLKVLFPLPSQDGRLQAGDQLLEVDSKNLVGLTQERAAELMKETGQVVNLCVAKQVRQKTLINCSGFFLAFSASLSLRCQRNGGFYLMAI